MIWSDLVKQCMVVVIAILLLLVDQNGSYDPQAYKDNVATYLPHVHFLISTKDNKKFNEVIKTHTVHCDVTKKELKKIIK